MNIRWKTRKWLIYKSGDLFLTRRSRRLRRAKGDTLGLKDTFNDSDLGNPAKKFSRNNYMDYDIVRKMFFKTQIQTIINNIRGQQQ